MIRMSLCPNCRTIQKHGTACTICKCPITSTPVSYPKPKSPNGYIKEDYELQSRRHLARLDKVHGSEEASDDNSS